MPRQPKAASIADLRSLYVPTDRDAALTAQLDRLLQVDADGPGGGQQWSTLGTLKNVTTTSLTAFCCMGCSCRRSCC